MRYFFPKEQKSIEAESLEDAIELLHPKKSKNVWKNKKSVLNK